jgi:hypothetical protein
MTGSSPFALPSFDPALHLHSEDLREPSSQNFEDELEALHQARLNKTRNKVVIQHRAWNLSDVFRSDEDVRPGTLRTFNPWGGCFLILQQRLPQDRQKTRDYEACALQFEKTIRSRLHPRPPECRSYPRLLPFPRAHLRRPLRNGRMASNRNRRNPSGRRSWQGSWTTMVRMKTN